MPQAIPLIVYAATTAAGFTATQAAFAATVASFATSLLFKPKKASINPVAPRDRSQMIRATDSTRDYVYGRSKKSGSLLFLYASKDKKYLYLVVSMASHPIQELEKIYLNDSELDITNDFNADTSYSSTGITHLVYKTGSVPDVDADHEHREFETREYDIVGGNRVFKPALWMDYSLGSSSTGVNKRFQSEINADAGETIISNTDYFRGIACVYLKLKHDPDVYRGAPTPEFLIKGKNNILDTRDSTQKYTTNPALCLYDYLTDTLIGLGADSSEIETTAVSNAANICDESVSLNGGGSETRYTCNGIIDSEAVLEQGAEAFLSAMAGSMVYVNGKFRMLAGSYRTPTITLTEDDFVDRITLGRAGRKDKFNAVKGVYIDETQEWKPTDFPHVTNSTYETEDGERLYKDLQLPFTISPSTAQRMAKIELERNRQDITCEVTLSLRQWDFAAGDNIMVTYSPFGWSGKVFEVIERGLTVVQADRGPYLAVKAILKETSSTDYTWSSDETIVDSAPNTNLPDAFSVDAPTNLTLTSDESQLVRGRNGRIVSRIKVSWGNPVDEFVRQGGHTEIFYKKSSDSNWIRQADVLPTDTFAYITDVDDREQYDVRIRSVNYFGAKSAYVSSLTHTVIGKTTPPPNVTGFAVAETAGIVKFKWDQLSVLDVYGYEIRYGKVGVQWKDASLLVTAKQGTTETNGTTPPGTWAFLIKAVDGVGLYSNSASVISPITVTNANTILNAIADGEFPGTLDNFVRHYTGVLVPDSQNIADEDGWDTFDTFVPNPEQICIYTSDLIGLGSDKDVRVWGIIDSELGVGVTEGIADPKLQISYYSTGDSVSGGTQTDQLISSSGTFTNCILHYTGAIVPDSNSLASVDTWDIFDEFVYDAKESCSYESPEADYGADTNLKLELQQDVLPGPGETGTSEVTAKIDTRLTGGTYDGYENFAGGTYNLRYAKIKMEWNNISNVSYIDSLSLTADSWRDWINGNIKDVRYIQARIRLDTDVGLAKITDFNWVIDEAV